MNTSKLKVGWVAPCVGIGGADAYMLGLIKYCYNLEFTGVAIADSTSKGQIDWVRSYIGYRVPFHQIGHNCPRFPDWNYYDDFAQAIYAATNGCDIIITWGCKDVRNHYYAIDKPIVELVQNEDEFAMEIVRDNQNYVDFSVAVSKAVANAMPKQPDTIIYNAIDPGRCVPRYGREQCREMWGLQNRKVILFMGRLVEEKNPASLIAALKHLPKEYCVLFVGRGYRRDDLIREAQRHVGRGRVYFARPQYHVGDLFAAADAFVLPSDFEGHPLAVCEAWYAGTPVVCTNFTVMEELRSMFGNLCTIVPKKCSAETLAKGILRATDTENEKVMQERALANSVVWNNFLLPTVAVQWEEFLYDCYHKWYAKRSRMEVFEVDAPQPLTTSKAHLTVVDTSQESIARWDRV